MRKEYLIAWPPPQLSGSVLQSGWCGDTSAHAWRTRPEREVWELIPWQSSHRIRLHVFSINWHGSWEITAWMPPNLSAYRSFSLQPGGVSRYVCAYGYSAMSRGGQTGVMSWADGRSIWACPSSAFWWSGGKSSRWLHVMLPFIFCVRLIDPVGLLNATIADLCSQMQCT